MKKILALVCAAMLCACCLALAACGGGSASSAASASASASSESASASSAAKPANPADKFIGNWALVGAKNGEITMTGDFAAVLGEELDISLTVNADGTATLSYNEDSIDCNWELKNDNTISMTAANLEDTSSGTKLFAGEAIDVNYIPENKTLDILDAESGAELVFSQTGAIEGMLDITASNAKPITSKDALVGTWRIRGMNMMGVMMYGDADALAEYMGDSDLSLVVNSDGTATIMGEGISWTADSNGASFTIEGVTCPVYDFGNGDILLDLTAGIGETLLFVYTK